MLSPQQGEKMKSSRFWFITLVFACLIVSAVPLFSQSTTAGDINGVVTDQSGAVIPNAQVTAKNDATGATHATTSNSEGFYRFSLLTPGTYTVTANAPNLQTNNKKVQVGVGQATTANISMSVATAITTVEVTTEGLQVENGDNSTHFDSTQISLIPNPGNDLSAIAQTAPGVVMNTQGGFGNFSAYGLPGTSNLFTLDGQNDNDPFLNLNNSGATNLLLGTNEVGEATVVTNGYSGQYGQLAGAQVNYVTKSGGNDFHGNAVYYWNGRAMNANNFFNNNASPSTPRPFDNVNQWAVSVGGPIIKNKTFFFFDYEGLRVVLPTSAPAFIPSQQFQAATIANLTATSPASVPFFQNMFNLYNAAPGAAGATTSSTCGAAGVAGPGLAAGDPCISQFRSTAGNFTHEFLAALRVDQTINNNNSLFARVQTDHGLQATVTDPISSAFNAQSDQPEYQGQLGWTHVAGNTVNEFKMSGQWYSALFTNPNRAATLAAFPTTLQLGDGSINNLGGAIGEVFPQGRNVTSYQFVDDYSLTRGNHTLKFGVNYHRNDVTDFSPQEFTQGLVVVNTLQDLFNGGGTGDLLIQRFPSRLSQPIALYGVGFYGQDEWRLTPHLRVTLALRLDHNSNPVCQTNCFARLANPFTSLNHDPTIPYNQVIQSGLHQAYPSTDAVVWQPRLGFAWSPFAKDKTVIRGGIGIFGDSFPATIVDSFLQNAPALSSFNAVNLPISPAAPGNLFAANAAANASFQSSFAGGGTLASIEATNPAFVPPNFTTPDANVRQPRYQEWNLELQQDIGWNTFLSLNYVGNHGIFEPVQNAGLNAFWPTGQFLADGVTPNPFPTGFGGLPTSAPDPRFGTVTQIQSIAVSNYNGLVTSLRHNFTHGLRFQANYTWSHALDEISNGGLLQFNAGTNPSILFPVDPNNLRANYGNADYDIRRYFSLNYVWDDSFRHLFHWGPNAIFSGWTVSGTIFDRSGLPFTVVDGGTTAALSGNNYGSSLLANIVGPTTNGSCGKQNATGSAPPPCLNAAGFASPTSVDVNQGRNQFRGPGYFDTDMSIMKYTKLAERANLGIGLQFFNLFNHPNFDQPVADISNNNFGLITRTVNTPTSILGSFLGGDASPRLIQFKAEFKF
jgi:outer membrane receptor protein involved in Fe transport